MTKLEELKRAYEQLEARVTELELAFYEVEFEEADPLEAAHQMFVNSIRLQREGNA